MKSRNLSNRTKEMLKDWHLGNLPDYRRDDLIINLIDELGVIKRSQAEKIRKSYSQ